MRQNKLSTTSSLRKEQQAAGHLRSEATTTGSMDDKSNGLPPLPKHLHQYFSGSGESAAHFSTQPSQESSSDLSSGLSASDRNMNDVGSRFGSSNRRGGGGGGGGDGTGGQMSSTTSTGGGSGSNKGSSRLFKGALCPPIAHKAGGLLSPTLEQQKAAAALNSSTLESSVSGGSSNNRRRKNSQGATAAENTNKD